MNWKLWLNSITFVALGLIIVFAWRDIQEAFGFMGQLSLWVLLLTIPAQLLVYVAWAQLFHSFFKASGVQISLRQLFAPMVELNFVNHVFPSGGVSGFSYLTLRLKALNVSTAKSTLAQLSRYGFTFISFVGLLLLALLLLAIEDRTSSLLVLIISALTFTILFGMAVLVFVLGNEQRITVFTSKLARALNKLIHVVRRNHPETIRLHKVEKTFFELHEDYKQLRANPKHIRKLLIWATVVNLAELSLLYIVFIAHGTWVNPGAVIVAFAVANLAALIAILPGGIGVYEPLMTGVLIAAGVPAALALSTTLVYRVIALLISLLTGYVLYHRAIHRYGTTNLSRRRTR